MSFKALLERWSLVPVCYSEISSGWIPLVDELISKLVDLGWDREVFYIQEQGGRLHFGIKHSTPEMARLIRDYSTKSEMICAVCGGHGERKRWGENVLILTRCDSCAVQK